MTEYVTKNYMEYQLRNLEQKFELARINRAINRMYSFAKFVCVAVIVFDAIAFFVVK